VIAYENLKTKEKTSQLLTEVVAVAYSLSDNSNKGFTMLVVTRAGCL